MKTVQKIMQKCRMNEVHVPKPLYAKTEVLFLMNSAIILKKNEKLDYLTTKLKMAELKYCLGKKTEFLCEMKIKQHCGDSIS